MVDHTAQRLTVLLLWRVSGDIVSGFALSALTRLGVPPVESRVLWPNLATGPNLASWHDSCF